MLPIIQVDNLTKRYKNANTNAVDGISFTVAPGEFFTLLGPNGAGKTTTISILTTTLSPTSGTARSDFDVSSQPLGDASLSVTARTGSGNALVTTATN